MMQVILIAIVFLLSSRMAVADPPQFMLTAVSKTVHPGQRVVIPVTLVAGARLEALQARMHVPDNAALHFVDIQATTDCGISAGLVGPNDYQLAMACTTALTGPVHIANLRFDARSPVRGRITFSDCRIGGTGWGSPDEAEGRPAAENYPVDCNDRPATVTVQ